MPDDRARILGLLREGKITVEEAEQLLDALGPGPARGAPREGGAAGQQRRLCVRITDLRTGKVKTNVRLPPGAWGMLSKLTRTKLGRRLGGQALYDIQRAAREGASGHIVDVTEENRGERVEIFFE
jgi:hypothetical protein